MATYDDVRGVCLKYLREVEHADRGSIETHYVELVQG
jgi:hypothetical protein